MCVCVCFAVSAFLSRFQIPISGVRVQHKVRKTQEIRNDNM